jgi:hypothetical protein
MRFINESAYLKGGTVYAMWDIHSRERILIPNYWKYPKAAILRGMGSDLLPAAPELPEDLYLFDDSLEWTLITTHENDGRRRLCFAAGTAAAVEQ